MHATYRESIQELIDGTIGAIRRAELERHLAECAECRSFLADMEAIRQAAESLDALEPPDGVWLQVAGRLRQEGRVQALPAPAPSRASHYAVLAIGIGIGFLATQYRTPSGPAQTVATAPAATTTNAASETVDVQSVEAEF